MEIQLNDIPSINKDVIWRYEPLIKQGTVFIYHIENQRIHEGNEALNTILELIDGTKTIENIINEIQKLYCQTTFDEIKDGVFEMCLFLTNQEIIFLHKE